jgi:hypothetical protein
MTEEQIWDWDRQTAILKANGYTTEEINDRSFQDRHNMIRNNCPDFETGDFYYDNEYER